MNAVLSKVSDAKLVYFHVYCNGIFAREVNTSSWTPRTPVTISNICNLEIMDKTSEYDILIFKETEAQFSDTKVTPNYITFYRFAGDSGMRILPPVKEKKKKIDFLVLQLLAFVICVRWNQKCAVQSPTMEQLVKRNNIFPQVGRT